MGNKLVNQSLDESLYEFITDPAILEVFEDAECVSCGESLRGAPVYGYEHPDGINVDGKRLWVFATCPECKYQNSLAKIMTLKKQANPRVGEVEKP